MNQLQFSMGRLLLPLTWICFGLGFIGFWARPLSILSSDTMVRFESEIRYTALVCGVTCVYLAIAVLFQVREILKLLLWIAGGVFAGGFVGRFVADLVVPNFYLKGMTEEKATAAAIVYGAVAIGVAVAVGVAIAVQKKGGIQNVLPISFEKIPEERFRKMSPLNREACAPVRGGLAAVCRECCGGVWGCSGTAGGDCTPLFPLA